MEDGLWVASALTAMMEDRGNASLESISNFTQAEQPQHQVTLKEENVKCEEMNSSDTVNDSSRSGHDNHNGSDVVLRMQPENRHENKEEQLCGWLSRFSPRGIVRTNRRRWALFSDKNCKLYFYRSPRDLVPLGEIDIACASLSFDPNNIDKPGMFQIRSEGCDHQLDAFTRHQMMHWLQELQKRRRAYSIHLVSISKGTVNKLAIVKPNIKDLPVNNQTALLVNDMDSEIKKDGVLPKKRQAKLPNTLSYKRSSFNFKSELQSVVAKFRTPNDCKSDKSDKSPGVLPSPSKEEWQLVDMELCNKAEGVSRWRLKNQNQNQNQKGNTLQISPFQQNKICYKCAQLASDYDSLKEELQMTDTELQANREVINVLQKEINSVRKEMATRFEMEENDEDKMNLMIIKRDYKIAELEYSITDAGNENCLLKQQITTLEGTVDAMGEENVMFHDMLKAKSETIMNLTNRIFELENSGNNDKRQTIICSNNLDVSQVTSEIQDWKDLCAAYEDQNKFLTEEIKELSELRLNDEAREKLFSIKYANLEAYYYKTKSKYLFLLKEVKSPIRGGDEVKTQEAVDQLLQDALESDAKTCDDIEFHFTASTKQYDRYGFVKKYHNEAIEDPLVDMATKMEMMSEEVASRIKEAVSDETASHHVKWENFMVPYEQGGKVLQRSPELKQLIRSGVPHEYKECIWQGCINFHIGKLSEKCGPSYYQDLVKKSSSLGRTTNPAAKQIELDLLRTLPDNKHFDSIEREGIGKLRRILLAFSWHNPVVGYCQGLNRLVAILLLFLSEENSFWGLVAIVDFIMPQDYFSKTLLAAQADQRVLKDLIQEKLPKVYAHLALHRVELSMFMFTWFLTVFVDNVSPETFLRIWDAFLYEGSKVLFRFGVAFFKYTEEDLLQETNSLDVNRFLRTVGERMTDIKAIANIAFNTINPFSMRVIATKRQFHLQQTRIELAELERLREEQHMHHTSIGSFSSYVSDDDL